MSGSWQPAGSIPSRILVWCVLLTALLEVAGCKRFVSDTPVGKITTIPVPLGLPPVPFPADNPPTAETIALGRKLFYDTKLSQDNSTACSTCHNPGLDFTDALSISRGVRGMAGVRNAPTVVNSAYLPLQFWDGRAVSLEEQAASPIANPVEMNQTHEVSVSKLNADPAYGPMFTKAYGSNVITIGRIQKALASFERTLLSGNSTFDRYQFAGDKQALTPSQVRGLALFLSPAKGNCAACHIVNSRYALFTDGKFHNLGQGVGDDGEFKDVGRFHQTKNTADQGAFKTPTLRDVAKTGPYMHDGSLKTLGEVVDFYAGGGNSNPQLDKEIRAIKLDGRERSDLVEFLQSLTGEMPGNIGPP